MKVVATPPLAERNEFYPSNRVPLLPSPLLKLPTGSIRPRGWLLHQLELMADGLTGRLPELSQSCQLQESAWGNPTGEGESGWEDEPYWLRGFIALGYILRDERILGEARRWIEPVLASQEPDGYFGPRVNKRSHDLWPNMIMLGVLRTYQEATGDQRVLPFMLNFCRWLMTLPFEHFLPESWQRTRGGDLLDSVYWLCNRTEEPWLLDLARIVHERTADWTHGIPTRRGGDDFQDWHGVNLTQGFREPAQFYPQAQDIRYLQATERNYDFVMAEWGQVPGGMFGADEPCRPGRTGPEQAAETCSMVELMRSHAPHFPYERGRN